MKVSSSPQARVDRAAPRTRGRARVPALLGGEVAFPEPLHVGRPNVGNRQRLLQRIERMLEARWFSNSGPLVQEFESEIARQLGVKHCVATCNGTAALMLAVRGLEL